jgi:hypothetical protein
MSRATPCAVVDRRPDVEPVRRGWIGLLWAALVLLNLVLPACAHAGAAGAAPPGLGVSRAALQAVFGRQELGFTFMAPDDRKGVPRVMGTVPDKLVALALVGPPEDLIEVTLMVGVPSTDPLAPPNDPKAVAENATYLRVVLQHAMPDWKDGVKWLNTQLQGSAERVDGGLRKGHRDIVLLAVNHWSMALLSIRVGQPPAPHGQ